MQGLAWVFLYCIGGKKTPRLYQWNIFYLFLIDAETNPGISQRSGTHIYFLAVGLGNHWTAISIYGRKTQYSQSDFDNDIAQLLVH